MSTTAEKTNTAATRAQELLEDASLVHVASLNADGTPHNAPVWGAWQDGRVVVNSAEGRTWPQNVRRDPRVTLTVVNKNNPYEYISIKGRVVEDTHDGADDTIDALAKTYLNADSYPFRSASEQRVNFVIEPEKYFYNPGG